MREQVIGPALAALMLVVPVAWAGEASQPAKPAISLTLIPPSPVTDRIVLDIRGAVWNRKQEPRTFDVAFYLDGEKPETLLHRVEEGAEALEVRHAALKKPVALEHRYDPRYPGGGDGAMTDGLRATSDYRDPAWQGYWEDDLTATIDLGRPTPLKQFTLGCLQQTAAGIFLPAEVRVEVSTDGREFREVGTVKHQVPLREEGPLVHRFTLEPAGTEARRVRVTARNVGRIPGWHPARGQKAWLFVDEILINPQ